MADGSIDKHYCLNFQSAQKRYGCLLKRPPIKYHDLCGRQTLWADQRLRLGELPVQRRRERIDRALDHTTIFHWVQAYDEEFEKRLRTHLRPSTASWRVDETYTKVKSL